MAQADDIRRERARLLADLNEIPGVHAYSSEANFILFRVAKATGVYEGLKRRGVLIKNLQGGHQSLADCLRVTVGTQQENERFIAALKESLQEV